MAVDCNTNVEVGLGNLDGIKCKATDVVGRVMDNLRTAKIDGITVNEDGTVKIDDNKFDFAVETEHNNNEGEVALGSLSTQFENQIITEYQGTYNTNKKIGLEVIVEAIVREVMDEIVNNATVNMKERMDALENDYNALIIAMNTAGVGLGTAPLTPVGSALTGIATAGGGTTRPVSTTQLKIKNEKTDIG